MSDIFSGLIHTEFILHAQGKLFYGMTIPGLPLVSIVMLSYNQGQFIEETLRAIYGRVAVFAMPSRAEGLG